MLKRKIFLVRYNAPYLLLAMGVARHYASLNKWAFIEEGLAQRGIQRHYDTDELTEDLTYAHHSE